MRELSATLTESIRRLNRVDRQIAMTHSALEECSAHLKIILNKIGVENSVLKLEMLSSRRNNEESSSSSSSFPN